jgi:hypothetical protein
MKIRVLVPTVVGMLLTGLVPCARAEIKLHDAVSVSGFLSGSYQLDQPRPGSSTDHLGLDDALLAFRYASAPVGAVASLYHVPDAPEETAVLDAYVSYDAGDGVTVTAGKFQSLIGYEAFFSPDNPSISFANNELISIAPPNYHSGLKLERGTDAWSLGLAVLDCIYSSTSATHGDGELKNNQGYEAYVGFKAIKDLVINVSAGYEGRSPTAQETFVYDVWASCQITPATKLVADWSAKDAGTGDRGYNWIALVDHALGDRTSVALRVSGEYLQGGGRFTRYTVTPALQVTPALTLRAEVSHTDYQRAAIGRATAVGVQAFLKF